MADKIFCGSGKEFGKYGQIGLNLCLSDIPKEHMSDYKGKKYIKLKVSKRKEPDKMGNSHYIEVDTWKPTPKEERKEEPKEQNIAVDPFFDKPDDTEVPF